MITSRYQKFGHFVRLFTIFLFNIVVLQTALYAQFSRIAVDPGVEVNAASDGGQAWGDLNEDGYPDLIIFTENNAASVDARMFFNDGATGSFTDVTVAKINGFLTSTTKIKYGRQLLIADFNNDGLNDILAGGGGQSDVHVYLNNGAPIYTFGDVAMEPHFIISSSLVTDGGEYNMEGIGAIDWNQDGLLDIIMDNDGGSNDIFENNGDTTFTFIHPTASSTPTGFPVSHAGDGDYLTVADINNDGYVDLYGRKTSVSNYWKFDPQTAGFVNQPNPNITSDENDKGGTMFCDFDSDGDLDLFWTSEGNNEIWRNDGRDINGNDIWTATGLPSGAIRTQSDIDGCDCGDVDNDGDIDILLGASSGDSYLLENQFDQNGTLSFVQNSLATSANTESLVLVDYDVDGDLDLYFVTRSGSNQLWENSTNDSNYLFVDVKFDNGNGTQRDAIGANVILLDCDQNTVGMRQVNGAKGHGAQHVSKLHFGVDPTETYTLVAYYVFENGTRKIVKRSVRPDEYAGNNYVVYNTDSNEDNSTCSIDSDNDGVIDVLDIDSDNDGVPNAIELICGNGDWSQGGSRTGTVALIEGADTVATLGTVAPIVNINQTTGSSFDYNFIENGFANAVNGTLDDGIHVALNGDPTAGKIVFDFGASVLNLSIDIGDLDSEIIDSIKAYKDGAELVLGINNFSNINSQVNYQGNTLFSFVTSTPIPFTNNDGSFTMSIANDLDSFLIFTHGADVDLSFTNIQYCEAFDSDMDGVADYQDLDSDNDGIPDLIEAGGIDADGDGRSDDLMDTDLDGLIDQFDNNDTDGPSGDGSDPTTPSTSVLLDTNQDGITDSADNDNDSIANYLDLDSDNDGIPDIQEMGGIDTTGDGRLDERNLDGTLINDLDQDGFADHFDPDNDLISGIDINGNTQPLVISNANGDLSSGLSLATLDIDSDDFPNYLDLDADGDGIADLIEAGGLDIDGNGMVVQDPNWDEDQDGYTDLYDANAADGPGSIGTNGVALTKTTLDDGAGSGISNDGHRNGSEAIISGWLGINLDSDNDNIATFYDLDSDNDGLTDAFESPSGDQNNDGLADDKGAYNDINSNGWEDSHEARIINSADNIDVNGWPQFTASSSQDLDLDGFPAWIDIDSDNDGIVDNTEAQATASYIAPAITDTDKDGLDTAYDNIIGHGGSGLAAVNTDSNDLPDYLDDDSDNDGEGDVIEGHDTNNNGVPNMNAITNFGTPTGSDIDGDGLDDGYDMDTASADPTNSSTEPIDYPENDLTDADQDWRAANANVNGILWEDANEDGLYNNGEILRSSITVTLYTAGNVYVDDVQTNLGGGYIFTDVAPGDYYVVFAQPAGTNGFTYKDQGMDDSIDSDVNSTSGQADNFTLSTGNPQINLSAGAVDAPLPVELTYFSGKAMGCKVELFWRTAVEINFSHFSLERSFNGREYEEIEIINSNGSNGATYQFIDQDASSNNYYRLKMIDFDSAFDYSEILNIETDCTDRITELTLFPNPINTNDREVLNIKMFAELDQDNPNENIELVITDQLGREVLKKSVEILDGWNTSQIEIDNLGSGIYFVRPNIGKRIIAQKFMILNNN